jgi:cytochrome c peroxidase
MGARFPFLRPVLRPALAAALLASALPAVAQDLPPGSKLGEAAPEKPRHLLATEEQGGTLSYMAALGATAFSAPALFGDPARRAGISCNTCHVNGESNPAFFIPGLSRRPGTIDVSNSFFHAKADDGRFNPVVIPSLRGIRHLSPYGKDGRIASLREFVRNVIVGEFAGAEPSPLILDALVAYLQEIDFLPNPRLAPAGLLAVSASAEERRGEALFKSPMANMGQKSCASCHEPSAAFTDRGVHDVSSGGFFKTPALLNANFRPAYFHDGRYGSYEEVIEHFDRTYALGFSAENKAALAAYLRAVGDGERPADTATLRGEMAEVARWTKVLDQALADRDLAVIDLVVDTAARELARVERRFPEAAARFDPKRRPDRRSEPVDFAGLSQLLTDTARAAHDGRMADATSALAVYRAKAKKALGNYP